MKNHSKLFFFSVSILSLLSCTAPATEKAPDVDPKQIKNEIQTLEDAYATAMNNRNAEALGFYYADDAVSLPNNQAVVRGKAAILARLKDEIKNDTNGFAFKFEVQEIIATGDKAIEIGKSTITDNNGNAFTGKYISVFEKRDGKYVCIRDIWNNDAQAAGN